MATHSNILAWRIPWTRGGWWATYSPWKSQTQLQQFSTYAPELKRQEFFSLLSLICSCQRLSSKFFLLFIFGCARAFPSCGEQALLQLQYAGFSSRQLLLWWCTGSADVVPGLGCPEACGLSLDQGPNLCPLHWQVDSLFFPSNLFIFLIGG